MESDDEVEFSSYKGIPATIIYINIHDPGNYKTSEVAHAATCRLIRQYLRTSSSQFISVCLYGLESSNSSVFGIKTIQEVFPLNYPTLDTFKSLMNVNISTLKPTKELVLSDVLWHARKMFANCKKQLLSRNIIILSRFDVPPIQTDQKPAFKEAVDLSDSNIKVQLINITQVEYEINQFYKDFLVNVNKQQNDELPKPVWDQKEVEHLMHQHCNRHLAVAQLSFEIGDGLSIGVGVYSLLKGTQQKKTPLDSNNDTILTTVNKTMKVKVNDDDDAMGVEEQSQPKAIPLLKSEILFYQVYGGERVEFTDSEMKMLKNPFGPPKLKLLGFKPAHIICKEKWIFKPCYFLYPNEGIIEGSTIAFKALHQATIEMNMVAICVLGTRVNSRPRIVALSPCSKPLGLNVEIGFDIISIPFIENMRDLSSLEDEEDINVEDANKSVMKDILKALNFDYKPEMFEDPKQQSLYWAIEAIALEDDEIEPFNDTTKPDPKKFDTINDDLFHEIFGPFEITVDKRNASSAAGPPIKKPKNNDDAQSFLQDYLKNKQVHNYTVAQLKEVLRSIEVPELPALTGLKKADLVDLVYKHCN